MQIELGQNLKIQQRQAPCVIHGIQLMSLPYSALISFLQKVSLNNPLLEVNTDGMSDEETYEELIEKEIGEKGDFIEGLTGAHNPFDSVEEELKLELLLKKYPSDIEKACLTIFEELDEHGYWFGRLADLAMRCKIDYSNAEKALQVIQSLEPVGIGARSLTECLIMQLSANDIHAELMKKIIKDDIEELSKDSISYLQKKYQCSRKTLNQVLTTIKNLNPYPLKGNFNNVSGLYIIPEISIRQKNGKIEAKLYRTATSMVSMDKETIHYLDRSNQDEEAREYIKRCKNEAQGLIDSLKLRDATMKKILHEIVQIQRDYFLGGIFYLKPMTMQEVAERVEVSVSTVSRCVQDKYIETDFGTIQMKKLFSSKIKLEDGSYISSEVVRAHIKKILETETEDHYFSDSKLSELLLENNIKVSRRTISKYRDIDMVRNKAQRSMSGRYER